MRLPFRVILRPNPRGVSGLHS